MQIMHFETLDIDTKTTDKHFRWLKKCHFKFYKIKPKTFMDLFVCHKWRELFIV